MVQNRGMPEALTVRVVATEYLNESERAAIVAVCIAAHENEEFGRMFTHFIRSGGRHFLAYRGDELVSHAVVTTRWLQPEGQPEMKTAFVDAVSTLPAAQGQGFSSATMRRLGAEVGDYEIGCLQTDLVGFYERMGWEFWRGSLAGRGEHGLIPTPEQRGVMVLRLPQTPPLDLDMPLSIEEQPDRIWE